MSRLRAALCLVYVHYRNYDYLYPELQTAAGVSPAFVRLSFGIEDADDIIADIQQALEGV